MNTQTPSEEAQRAARQILIPARPAVVMDPDFTQQIEELAEQIETQGWSAVLAAVFALPLSRLISYSSAIHVGCVSWDEAMRIACGGPWRGSTSFFVPAAGHPLAQFPCALCLSLGKLCLPSRGKQ